MPANVGGLSLALAADSSKKRGLPHLNTSTESSPSRQEGQQHALQQAAGSGNYGGFVSPALSPLSSATPHSSRSPLSDALAISARKPRRKVARHQESALAESDESDDEGFAVGGGLAAGGWSIGVPPHLMTAGGGAAAAMSMPYHPAAADGYDGFRPGSVLEGAGRKLRGTDAMRMRNAVLTQTGFLEPHQAGNMFSDHNAEHAIQTPASPAPS